MSPTRKSFIIISSLSISLILAVVIAQKGIDPFTGLDLLILVLIIGFGIFAFYQLISKEKDRKEGYPEEDERSLHIKYKSGYYAYLISMYMWLFIFILKDKFPDIETMIGGGILLSALIGFLVKMQFKRMADDQ